jgi:hypothetical protein
VIYLHRIASRLLAGAGLLLAIGITLSLAVASPAMAAETAYWQLYATQRPTVLAPSTEATVILHATNLGSAAVSATSIPVTLTDKLPADVTAISAVGGAGFNRLEEGGGARGPVSCTLASTVVCHWEGTELLQPYEPIEVLIKVQVGSGFVGGENNATVEGGGTERCHPMNRGNFSGPFCREEEAVEVETGHYEAEAVGIGLAQAQSNETVAAGAATPFGLHNFAVVSESESGGPDTQAGSHPFQLSTILGFNESNNTSRPPAFLKDQTIELPPGLIGNAQAVKRCTEAQFAETFEEGGNSNLCPNESAVGVASVSVLVNLAGFGLVPTTLAVPVFNLTPGPGEPARFGFEIEKAPVVIDTSVRTGTDYGVVAKVSNASEFAVFLAADISLWGVPGASAHRLARGWSCVDGGRFFNRDELLAPCSGTGEVDPQPFLRLPTSCTGPLTAATEVDSWQAPAVILRSTPQDFGNSMQSLDGCARVPFNASAAVSATEPSSGAETGLSVGIKLPQVVSEAPEGVAESDVKDVTLTLPVGFALNAASANGLEACSESTVGFLPGQSTPEGKVFTPQLSEPPCPNASKIGTVLIKTPILEKPLQGSMYLAAQTENPFGSLVAIYILASDPTSGVVVKLPGEVSLDPVTGQVTTRFSNNPQAPISSLQANLFGGPTAALATPNHCGSYSATVSITPWSGNATVTSPSSIQITPGSNGCPAQTPFSPSVTAGTTNPRGGAFTSLLTTIERGDGTQNLSAVKLQLPPGLIGSITGVPECTDAQASAGACPASSLIGHVEANVGVGSDPVRVTGGAIYLTGPYEGEPFGLLISVPAKAGPFDLGFVNVRSSLAIDQHTAAVTVSSDPIPQILKGVPLKVKRIAITVDRSHFILNPTNCSALSISSRLTGDEGQSVVVATPFEATNCSTLAFAPKLAAHVAARFTRPNGATFGTKLTFPGAGSGPQSNIAKVKVVLPVQLPSRQSTLKLACLAATFEHNPAECGSGSRVGSAKAVTPLLPVPLTGPVYLVSHGGEAFPALTIVLQGDGVTYDLVGNTQIKKGITSTSFKQVADVPVSLFELTLPAGPHSALGAFVKSRTSGSLCGTKLKMPTSFVAQNGRELHQSIPIAVSGCKSAKPRKAKKTAR